MKCYDCGHYRELEEYGYITIKKCTKGHWDECPSVDFVTQEEWDNVVDGCDNDCGTCTLCDRFKDKIENCKDYCEDPYLTYETTFEDDIYDTPYDDTEDYGD